ncbi:MAG: hypothetical protein ACHP7P_03285 [Terriglobales bacterium]
MASKRFAFPWAMRVMPKLATLLVVVLASLLSAQKMTRSALVFKGQKVEITESGTTPDGVEPKGPAKICLVSSGTCFIPPNSEPQFGFSPEAKIVQLSPKQQVLLFTAVASASGSGSLTLLALLDIRNGSLENLLPDVRISEQGEYKIWNETQHLSDGSGCDRRLPLGRRRNPLLTTSVQNQDIRVWDERFPLRSPRRVPNEQEVSELG